MVGWVGGFIPPLSLVVKLLPKGAAAPFGNPHQGSFMEREPTLPPELDAELQYQQNRPRPKYWL